MVKNEDQTQFNCNRSNQNQSPNLKLENNNHSLLVLLCLVSNPVIRIIIMSVFKILPGSIFPDISLPLVGGGRAQLRADGRPKLLVVYRGAFCPFCKGKGLHRDR